MEYLHRNCGCHSNTLSKNTRMRGRNMQSISMIVSMSLRIGRVLREVIEESKCSVSPPSSCTWPMHAERFTHSYSPSEAGPRAFPAPA